MNECYKCGFNDEDYGCVCSSFNKWYACPIESKKLENIQALEEYAKAYDNMTKELYPLKGKEEKLW